MAVTEKQKLFAQKYIELGIASDAYRAAYNANKMSDNAIRVEAHRVLANPNVALIVEQLREKNAKRHEVTIDTITEMLKADHKLAVSLEQSSAAVAAAMGLAKLHGLIIDRGALTVTTHEDKLRQLESAMLTIDADGNEENHTVQ
jgi:phage terminase small subunit